MALRAVGKDGLGAAGVVPLDGLDGDLGKG